MSVNAATPTPIGMAAAPVGSADSGSLIVFECVMLVVLLVSGYALRVRRQQLASSQASRYQRLAQISAAATATASTPPGASPRASRPAPPGHARTVSSSAVP